MADTGSPALPGLPVNILLRIGAAVEPIGPQCVPVMLSVVMQVEFENLIESVRSAVELSLQPQFVTRFIRTSFVSSAR